MDMPTTADPSRNETDVRKHTHHVVGRGVVWFAVYTGCGCVTSDDVSSHSSSHPHHHSILAGFQRQQQCKFFCQRCIFFPEIKQFAA